MSARDRILARLAQAPAAEPVPLPNLDQWTPFALACGPAARFALFRDMMQAAHAEVHDTDEQTWPELLLALARQKGVRTLLVGTGTESAARLKSRTSETLHVMSYERPISQWRADLFDQVDAGFTQAKSAIAATGSLVLWPTPRSHVCCLWCRPFILCYWMHVPFMPICARPCRWTTGPPGGPPMR